MYSPIYSARIAELVMPLKGHFTLRASLSGTFLHTLPEMVTPLKGHFTLRAKLQALVYDVLPSTTAVFNYAIGSRKLSAESSFLLVLKQW